MVLSLVFRGKPAEYRITKDDSGHLVVDEERHGDHRDIGSVRARWTLGPLAKRNFPLATRRSLLTLQITGGGRGVTLWSLLAAFPQLYCSF